MFSWKFNFPVGKFRLLLDCYKSFHDNLPTAVKMTLRTAARPMCIVSSCSVGFIKLALHNTYRGMSTMVVIPPAAAALVAVSYPSQSVRPGSLMCTCASTIPGIITSLPPSITF